MRTGVLNSPVTEDHCFQRILLDNLCSGHWRKFITSPALRCMSDKQLVRAISMGNDIIIGKLDLFTLNRNSLNWRKASRKDNQNQQLTLFE